MSQLSDRNPTCSESKLLASRLRLARTNCELLALGTLIAKQGSTYRRAGARMLIDQTGTTVGLLSGGCLEPHLAELGQSVIETGEARTSYFDMTGPSDGLIGFGLGCKGTLEILIERLDAAQLSDSDIALLSKCHDGPKPGVVVTVISSIAVIGRSRTFCIELGRDSLPDSSELFPEIKMHALLAIEEGASQRKMVNGPAGTIDCFFDIIEARPHLVIIGAGDDALPLTGLAATLGWRVTVIDHRPHRLRSETFPTVDQLLLGTPEEFASLIPEGVNVAVVVMTHNYSADLRLLPGLVNLDVGYMGILGPRRRFETLVKDIDQPIDEERIARVQSPIGLDLGGDTPATIALSIVAEVQAKLAKATAASLHKKDRIHQINAHQDEPKPWNIVQ